jgi:O-antigen/teichoic acid export membrane protein
MRKKYFITFVSEFLVLVCGILVYRLAAVYLGTDGFSEYALSRRAVSLIQPALLMGLSVGVPRYIAYSFQSSKEPDFYFVIGATAVGLVMVVSVLIMYLLRAKLAFLLFGSSEYAYYVSPIILMLIGIISHVMCYSYYRGKLFMIKANLLQVINIAAMPLVAFSLSKDTHTVLTMLGGAWCVTSGVFFCLIMRGIAWPKLRGQLLPYIKELLSYSIPRVPGDFGMAALLSLVAFLTAHTASVKEAGYVAFGISILSAAGSSFAPIGVVLLPHASQMVANMEIAELKRYVQKILKISLSLVLLGVVLFEVFADTIIEIYLGSHFLEMATVARMIAIGAVPYTIFVTMRSVIDSYHVKALNTKNILISLLIFFVCGGLTVRLSGSYKYLIVEFVVALFVLGVLTLIDVRNIFVRNEGQL